jgi:hypothetical protein
LGLWYGRLALVHEVNDALDLPASDIFEDDDGVLAWVVGKDLLEIGTAEQNGKKYIVNKCIIGSFSLLNCTTMFFRKGEKFT